MYFNSLFFHVNFPFDLINCIELILFVYVGHRVLLMFFFFLNTCIIISKETRSQNTKEIGEMKHKIRRKLLGQIFQPKRETSCHVGLKLIYLDNTISNSEGCSKGLS